VATGTLVGVIAEVCAGSQGFGYDPVFFVPELGRTLAELTAEEKNRISHRAKAFRAMADILRPLAVGTP
jgi:XTP/dITP diphosphohydrolase